MRRARVALSFVAAALTSACGLLIGADWDSEPMPLGDDAGDARGGGGEPDAASPPDAGREGGGAPPRDFECAGAWSAPGPTAPECAPRVVTVVDPDPLAFVNGVSIARTRAGRVGITYNYETAEEGEMRLTQFVPASPGFTPSMTPRPTTRYLHTGARSRIVATGDDDFEVLAHDVDDGSPIGDVVVVKLAAGSTHWSHPQLVAGGVPSPSELALAVGPSGELYAAVRVETGATDAGTIAKLAAFKRPPGGSFSALPNIVDGLTIDRAPGVGASSLNVDATGLLHVAYHACVGLSCSTLRYRTLSGSAWSSPHTIDQSIKEIAGFDPSIAVAAPGPKKHAAYFVRRAAGGGRGEAELRVAAWTLTAEQPTIELLAQRIISDDPRSPRYRVAMAVDPYGLLHVVYVHASSDGSPLRYLRQTRLDDGRVAWLRDTIDPDVSSIATATAPIAIVVDDDARPHIAYVSGQDPRLRYATRYDR